MNCFQCWLWKLQFMSFAGFWNLFSTGVWNVFLRWMWIMHPEGLICWTGSKQLLRWRQFKIDVIWWGLLNKFMLSDGFSGSFFKLWSEISLDYWQAVGEQWPSAPLFGPNLALRFVQAWRKLYQLLARVTAELYFRVASVRGVVSVSYKLSLGEMR